MEYVCPILGQPTAVDRTAFGRDSWTVVRCRKTGFVFLANPPDYAKLATDFAWEKISVMERNRRDSEEPVVSRISALARNAATFVFPSRNKVVSLAFEILRQGKPSEALCVLDIGCGPGRFLEEIHRRCGRIERKAKLVGIEVSPQIAGLCRERLAPLGGSVICANAIDGTAQLKPESIHLAIMASFLEHDHQPLRLLKQLHVSLVSEGVIVLKVPNYACWNRIARGRKWCGFRFPDHVNYFTPETLRRLAVEAGFTVSRQTWLDKFPLNDNMYAVIKKVA
jgi:SAM-dependent methyltransferase